MGFYAGALLQAFMSLLINSEGLWDALGLWLLGYALRNFQSRAAAILAVIDTLAGALLTTPKGPVVRFEGGTAIVMVPLLVCAVLAVRASFAYHRLAGTRLEPRHILLKSGLGAAYWLAMLMAVQIAASLVWGKPAWPFRTYYVLFFVSFGLAFRGWLPGTDGRPFAVRPAEAAAPLVGRAAGTVRRRLLTAAWILGGLALAFLWSAPESAMQRGGPRRVEAPSSPPESRHVPAV
jgi:hypothetical protein